MKEENIRPVQFFGVFLTLFSLVLCAATVQARDVTFTWTANSEQVDGYRLYYKTGETGGSPYNGIGITEGNSPVDTGNVTTFTLHGLTDTDTYYFVLTAMAGEQESDYSTELTLEALPDTPPAGITANFSWLSNQESNVDGYKIHYGTASGSYDSVVDIGNPAPIDGRIQGTVPGLTEGTTYFFAATAYDTANNLESDFSAEITWTATSGTGSNNPPIAQSTTVSTSEDHAVSGDLAANNDSGLPITYILQQDVSHGTLLLETGTGHFTYTPGSNFAGTDLFTFLARDDNGDSNTATVSITITATNDPPIAQGAGITVSEDSTVNGQLQASDPDGDNLTYSVVTNPAKGTLNVTAATGAFTYTPNTNATGSDSFTFRASDGQVTSNIATISITITPVNDAPIAQNGSLSAVFGQTTSGTLHASDPDNDTLTYTLASDPQQVVTITNSATGAYTFTPAEDMNSPYSFTFTASDGSATSNTATVTVTLMETGIVTEIFGDTPDSDHPGTMADTFTNLNNDINASAQKISTWSWSSSLPHKPANTIIIKTDLSALPDNIEVTEAKLFLYQTESHGKATYENSIHKITGKDPIINQANGYNAYNGEPWTPVATGTTNEDIPLGLADIAQAEDTIILDNQSGYKIWTITNMVKNWNKKPEANFGLLIAGIPTADETGRIFASTENQNGSLRPKLVIKYMNKPPRPTIMSIKEIK